MAGLTEFYCRSNETSHASQFKWLDNTFNILFFIVVTYPSFYYSEYFIHYGTYIYDAGYSTDVFEWSVTEHYSL
jgi:hypothetical protein